MLMFVYVCVYILSGLFLMTKTPTQLSLHAAYLVPACSNLPAALHAGMERMKTCLKVCRAASKKPQNRSNLDINHILAETQAVQLLTQHGPGVHRDLCHVVQHCSLSQMSSFRLPGEHPHGLLIYVSSSAWIAGLWDKMQQLRVLATVWDYGSGRKRQLVAHVRSLYAHAQEMHLMA